MNLFLIFVCTSKDHKSSQIGNVCVSRAFGDFQHKKSGNVTVEPEISQFFTSEVKTVIIVCDGVTDVMSNEEIVRVYKLQHDCKEIVKTAYNMGSLDNISAAVIEINK